MAEQFIHATHVYPKEPGSQSPESLLYSWIRRCPMQRFASSSASPLPEVAGFGAMPALPFWFARNADFDQRFRERFAHLYELSSRQRAAPGCR